MDTNNCEHIWNLMAKQLAGEATEQELQELEYIMRQQPHLNFSREILLDFWQTELKTDGTYAENKYKELVQKLKDIKADEGKFDQNDHFIEHNNDLVYTETKSTRSRPLLTCIVILVLSAGIYFIYNSGKNQSMQIASSLANEITTRNGSKTNLLLPDGTKVWLNANSKISYEKNYGNKLREVALVGEAYFDVVKNAEKPFVIHTAKMDIKVLGTAFNVKCYPGEKTTETSLIRGSIEVTLKDRQEKIMLKPNEKLVIDNDEIAAEKVGNAGPTINAVKHLKDNPIISLSHLTFYPVDSTVIETAWTQNKFVFSSETFEEIALRMERWYNVKIEFANDSIKNDRFTGNFEKETITEALNAMQLTTAFSFTIKNQNILIK